jgi:hydrogenase-4 component E
VSGRLGVYIRIVALQGVMVGLLPLVAGHAVPTLHLVFVATAIIGLKGFVFPYLLSRALRESKTRREMNPFVGHLSSVFFGILALLGSFWMDSRLSLQSHSSSELAIPMAFTTILIGLFLIVTRRTALSQVIGFLVLENGIYAFGLAIVYEVPVLLELGVLMDVFVAVFVMGIAIYHINREFDHMDIDRLNTLRG